MTAPGSAPGLPNPAVAHPSALASLLKRHFGHDEFRPMQADIIADALAGRDVFVVMPTGGGKSLCYQLPAVAQAGEQKGTTVVISPLIALMHNQVELLQANGIRATLLNSTVARHELAQRERDAIEGWYDLLYMAPERLMSGAGRALLSRLNVARFAIDEAHCISEWGHDFRPEYRMLGQLRHSGGEFDGRFADTPLIALTATATPRVAEDIVEQLHLRDPVIYRAGFERTNLYYEVRPKQGVFEQVLRFLQERPADDGIIYCASRNGVDELAERLRAQGIAAVGYHAGMETAARHQAQHDFIHGEARVCVATIAFGMGVDKPDVRFVIHADLPRHLEGYYQETGRAGRDGLPADCILFYSPGDRAKVEYFINQKESEAEREHAQWQLKRVINYAHTTGCRMVPLLAYFGENFAGSCGHCDNCRMPPRLSDATQDAKKLLSAVARTGQRFGLGHVINVLRGSKEQRVLDRRHDELSVYGIGVDQSVGYWRQLAEVLIHDGYLALTADEYRTAYLTEDSKALLRGGVEVSIPISRAVSDKAFKQQKKATPGKRAPIELSPRDQPMFEALRDLRTELARQEGVPPYIIFGDRALIEMATHRPTTDAQFLAINGVGQAKLDRYGQQFMAVIRESA